MVASGLFGAADLKEDGGGAFGAPPKAKATLFDNAEDEEELMQSQMQAPMPTYAEPPKKRAAKPAAGDDYTPLPTVSDLQKKKTLAMLVGDSGSDDDDFKPMSRDKDAPKASAAKMLDSDSEDEPAFKPAAKKDLPKKALPSVK